MAITKYYKALFLLSTPICLIGIALGGRVVPIVFGEAMAPAALPTQIFFGIFILSFFGTPLSMSLYTMERSHYNLVIYSFLAVVNIGLDLILIPRYGIIGAMIPVAIAIAISPFLFKRAIDRLLPGVAIPMKFIGRCFLASSPALLLLPLTRWVNGPLELSVALFAACGLVFFGFKWSKVIGEEELDLLSSIPIPISGRLLKFISS